MKRPLTASALLVCLLCASPALARPAILSLTVDHGEPLTLNGSASSVFIANPEIADVQVMSPSQVMIFGKRTGETTFMATDSKGQTLAERTVVVSQDLSVLRTELAAALPGNTVKVSAVPNGLVLTGTAKDPASVADAYKIAMRFLPSGGDIINRIQVVGSNQVQIRVRFAEVQRNVDNTLGFNWQNIATLGGPFVVGLATGNGVHMTGTGTFNSGSANNTGLFPRPNNTTLSTANNVLGASFNTSHLTLEGMIDALAQDGLLTILAEPTLTAMSGETANFLAGGQFPIPIPQGNGTISIQFQPYGISLAFTPTLLSGNRISLHVRPEVSELTSTGSIILNNITIPALTTRKAETTVEIASGESFAIAGLMNNSQSQTVNKFPMLGDIPVLGALFRSDHFVNGQTELVVIITPYVVKPSGEKLALPTDNYATPSEYERLYKLRYSSENPDARPLSGEPTAVMAAPAAAPVAPVTTTPYAPKLPDVSMPPVPLQTKSETPAPKPTLAATPAAAPVTEAASSPIVLHTAADTTSRSGGLLVE